MFIQEMVRWRLMHGKTVCKLGSTMAGFDASNASMSVNPEDLDELMEQSFEFEQEKRFMRCQYKRAVVALRCNADEDKLEVRPGCGFLQGGVTGPGVFNAVYSSKITEWEEECE